MTDYESFTILRTLQRLCKLGQNEGQQAAPRISVPRKCEYATVLSDAERSLSSHLCGTPYNLA